MESAGKGEHRGETSRNVGAPLPGFDSELVAGAAGADGIPWARHVEEFRAVRLATLSLFRNLPAEAWARKGVANANPVTVRVLAWARKGVANANPVTVRVLAWFIAGHAAHHMAVLKERYL